MIDLEVNYTLEKYGFLDGSSFTYLKDLYLPIISHDAFFLYIYLTELIKDNELLKGKYGDLIASSTLSAQEFMLARISLESIGLVTTYKNKNTNEITIVVVDALTPKKFFSNLSLAGLLVQTIGKEKYDKLVKKYSFVSNKKDLQDISAKFSDSYTLDFKLTDIASSEKANLLGRNLNVIRDDFDDMKLFASLTKNYGIKVNALSEEEVNYLHGMGSLLGMSEKMVAALAADNYESKASYGNRIDKAKFKKQANVYVKTYKVADIKVNKKTNIEGDSEVAQKIKYYENISPREFLKNAQKGVDVVPSDLNLLESLSMEFRMTNGMINALIDYVLNAKNGDLSSNYVKKIASSLIRKNCHDTLDVMNALYGKSKNLKDTDSLNSKEKEKATDVIKADDYAEDDYDGLDELLEI